MSNVKCIFTGLIINSDNIEKIIKGINIIKRSGPINKAYMRILTRYNCSNFDDYIQMLQNNLSHNSLNVMQSNYNTIKQREESVEIEQQKSMSLRKIQDSIKRIDENISIRMLTDSDENDAVELYILFKKTMQEDIVKAKYHTEDFILKNIMFGLFVNDKLAGFVIIQYIKKIRTDFSATKIDTFYIQELLVHPDYRGNNLSKLLIEYCIYRCPKDKSYISLMTKPDNTPLIKVAEKCGFERQKVLSGDKVHSLLMIRNMDKYERQVSKNSSF